MLGHCKHFLKKILGFLSIMSVFLARKREDNPIWYGTLCRKNSNVTSLIIEVIMTSCVDLSIYAKKTTFSVHWRVSRISNLNIQPWVRQYGTLLFAIKLLVIYYAIKTYLQSKHNCNQYLIAVINTQLQSIPNCNQIACYL